jgi:CheY-like chemotaxis protein
MQQTDDGLDPKSSRLGATVNARNQGVSTFSGSRGAFSSRTQRRLGRVLVVDDEPFLGEALHRALGDENQVDVVTDAASALARLQAGERYDVVLCDLMMPTMDGIDFHDRLSASLPEEANRIVFITGCAYTSRVESFFHRVPNTVLEKPVDIEGLRALIDRRVRGDPAAQADAL